MFSRFPHNPSAYDDDWEDQPAQGWFFKRVLGVVIPLVCLGFGLFAIVTRKATFGHEMPLSVYGLNAIASGVATCCAGIFLHCHYFWGNIYANAWPATLGKIVSLVGFIAATATLLVRFGVLGIK